MKKKIVSLALVLALCLSLLPVTAFAEEEPQEPQETQDAKTWGDKADTSWYVHETEPEYHIKTAEQLAGIAKLVNEGTVTFEGKTVYLDNDLDLAGIEWISIGTGRGGLNDDKPYCFCGTFDGQGHVISNLYSRDSLLVANEDNERNLYRTGLFGNVNGGEIRNLGVLDADVSIDSNDVSAAGEAILVDFLVNGKITNCWTTGRIASGSYLEKNIGGIVGVTLRKCTISGCYSTATLTGNFANSGGYYNPNLYLPPETIGGIVGTRFDGNLTVTDCWFGGKIVVNSILAAVGGIVGYTDDQLGSGTVNNCMVTTTDMGVDVDNDGNTCWVAYALGGTVENCYWPDDEKAYDPSPLKTNQGAAVANFTSEDVLAGLQANVGTGIEWVAGIGHPTFAWDKWHISADYSAVDAAITAAKTIDSNLYSNYAGVEKAIDAVDRTKSRAEQAEVDAMAQAINNAIAALEKKPSSSSSGSSRPRYDVTTPSKPENGSVTVDPERARSGSRVTVTVTPDSGYKLGELVVTDRDGKKLELTDKGNGQYTFTMPSGKVEVAAEFVKEVEVSPFADVATDAYYYDAVKWAVEKGVTNGVSETLFGPDQACTRAQIVTFLWRAAGSPEPKSGSSFADVAADAYYAKAVAWAVENGITKGTSETTFHPDETCTRAQGVTFLYRALGKLAAAQAGFTDVAADSYYADAVNWAAENGVTKGISETLFGPDGSCTRAQIVTFLYRAYQGK